MRKNIGKSDTDRIKNISQKSGTDLKSKSSDLSNGEDVKTLLKLTVGRYLDYFKYWNDLADIAELFDESLEFYNSEIPENLSNKLTRRDKLTLNTIFSLDKSIESFGELMESAENECKELLGQALKMEKNIKMEIFGSIFEYDESIIGEIFEEIHELEFHYNMEDAFDIFIKFVNVKFKAEQNELLYQDAKQRLLC